MMIKSLVLPVLVVALFAGGAGHAQAQALKIGTVDMKRVFESYYKTKDAEQRINEERNRAKKDLEDQMDNYKKATEEVKKLEDDASRPELSKDAKEKANRLRDERIGDLKSMERQIRDFQSTKEKQLQEQTMRMRAGIVDEINTVVSARVKASQFDLVLDRSGQSLNAVPLVLYARDDYDFTTDVITQLNKNKTASTSDDTPTAVATPKSSPKPHKP